MWSGLSFLFPKILAAERILPPSVSRIVDIASFRPPISNEQLSKINALGNSIGLEREETLAALEAPVSEPRKGIFKSVLRIMVVSALVVIVIGLVFIWRIVSPETFPIPTYAPGTDYGTIKPQDFPAGYPLSR